MDSDAKGRNLCELPGSKGPSHADFWEIRLSTSISEEGINAMFMAKGSPKPVATGKKGNVGGISTPGRHGSKAAAMLAGVKNLVSAGPGTTKAVNHLKLRPEGKVSIDAGNLKKASGMTAGVSGSPKKISGSGHKGVHMGVGAQVAVKRDAHGAVHTAVAAQGGKA